jgi:hypothetical protein
VVLGAVTVVMAVTGTAAPAASATDTKIVCDAVRVRAEPADDATALGIAYEGDTISFDQWVYVRAESRWYTRGRVTRQDGERISRGYVPYSCANPYQDPESDAPPEQAR